MMVGAAQSFWQQMSAKVVWAEKMAVRSSSNLNFLEFITVALSLRNASLLEFRV